MWLDHYSAGRMSEQSLDSPLYSLSLSLFLSLSFSLFLSLTRLWCMSIWAQNVLFKCLSGIFWGEILEPHIYTSPWTSVLNRGALNSPKESGMDAWAFLIIDCISIKHLQTGWHIRSGMGRGCLELCAWLSNVDIQGTMKSHHVES